MALRSPARGPAGAAGSASVRGIGDAICFSAPRRLPQRVAPITPKRAAGPVPVSCHPPPQAERVQREPVAVWAGLGKTHSRVCSCWPSDGQEPGLRGYSWDDLRIGGSA